MLTPDAMALIGRSLLLHGEFAGALTADGGLVPASSIDVFGNGVEPMEWRYRLFLPSPSGSEELVAPADSVLHVRIGSNRAAPWRGRSPLAGAMSDAELALATTRGLTDEARTRPLKTFSVDPRDAAANPVTFEEITKWADRVSEMPIGRPFFAPVSLRFNESHAAPAPTMDAMRRTSSEEIAGAAGVPVSLLRGDGDGAAAREGYRRLIRGTLEPLGRILAQEATLKLATPVSVDFAPLRGSDTAMMARAAEAFSRIEGVSPSLALELAGAVLPE